MEYEKSSVFEIHRPDYLIKEMDEDSKTIKMTKTLEGDFTMSKCNIVLNLSEVV